MQNPIQKLPKAKRVRDMPQVVECLPSKCKALSSKPATTKRKEEGLREGGRNQDINIYFWTTEVERLINVSK
jgi:hypothetical protein